MNRTKKSDHQIFNTIVLVQSLLFLLCIWGCLAIYNSNTLGASPLYFVSRQLLWMIIGLVLMLAAQRVPFRFYREHAPVFAAGAYISLVAVLLWGTRINGMCGWFTFGWTSASIQPSEFAKPFFILLLCHLAGNGRNDFKTFMLLALMTLLWVIPILLEPDAGTAAVYLLAFGVTAFLAGAPVKYLLALPALLTPAAVWMIYAHPYILRRFSGFWNPASDPLGSGWHIRQFQFTLARGGWFGVKMGKAAWANSYLPLAHSDSVFATVAESLGFAGTLPVILIFAIIIFALYRITRQLQSEYQKLFIVGMLAMIAVQTLIHVSVNVALLPPTGLTLPLLSYGGSSLLSTLLAFGIILSAMDYHPTEERRDHYT
ncbi:MAG: FtsW/RodA/SpoVE family cell cycle protein [Victivallaceae bacterium]|nr:FtsW/RodA/SpoVE family cell cycle protein [Victivallaceae bacterium]